MMLILSGVGVGIGEWREWLELMGGMGEWC